MHGDRYGKRHILPITPETTLYHFVPIYRLPCVVARIIKGIYHGWNEFSLYTESSWLVTTLCLGTNRFYTQLSIANLNHCWGRVQNNTCTLIYKQENPSRPLSKRPLSNGCPCNAWNMQVCHILSSPYFKFAILQAMKTYFFPSSSDHA